jgi:hypothetical protein
MKSLVAIACCLLLDGIWPRPVAAQTAANAPTHYVEVHGYRIGYRSIGKGTPLVLLTRFRGTLDTWDPLFLDRLARTHRVITLDYPGVGYSTGMMPTDIGQVAAFVNAFGAKIGLIRFAVLAVGRHRCADSSTAISGDGLPRDPRWHSPSRPGPGGDPAGVADSRAQTDQRSRR